MGKKPESSNFDQLQYPSMYWTLILIYAKQMISVMKNYKYSDGNSWVLFFYCCSTLRINHFSSWSSSHRAKRPIMAIIIWSGILTKLNSKANFPVETEYFRTWAANFRARTVFKIGLIWDSASISTSNSSYASTPPAPLEQKQKSKLIL